MELKIEISPEHVQWFSKKYPAFTYIIDQSGNLVYKIEAWDSEKRWLGYSYLGMPLEDWDPKFHEYAKLALEEEKNADSATKERWFISDKEDIDECMARRIEQMKMIPAKL